MSTSHIKKLQVDFSAKDAVYQPDLRINNLVQHTTSETANKASHCRTGIEYEMQPTLQCDISQLYFSSKADCFAAAFHRIGLPKALFYKMHFQRLCDVKSIFIFNM